MLGERFSQLHNRRARVENGPKDVFTEKSHFQGRRLCSPNCNVAFCSADGGDNASEREIINFDDSCSRAPLSRAPLLGVLMCVEIIV